MQFPDACMVMSCTTQLFLSYGRWLQADLVANIADLVDKGTITGVADVRDESDRTGMRIVVEARRGSATEVSRGEADAKEHNMQTACKFRMVTPI